MPWAVDLPPAEWFTCASKESRLTELGNSLLSAKEIALDTETTGLNNQQDRILYWSLAWKSENKVRRVCLRSELLWTFDHILRQDKTWVLANAKFDMHMLANTTGRVLGGTIADIAVMHALLYEEASHALKDINYQLFGWRWASFEETFGKVSARDPKDSYQTRLLLAEKKDLHRLVEYASNDAYGTLLGFWELRKRLKDRVTHSAYPEKIENLWDYFWITEAPFTRVLWLCERTGIGIDRAELDNIKKKVEKQLGLAERELYREAGTALNFRSTDQLIDYFFRRKQYKSQKKTSGGKSGIQKEAIDEEILEKFWIEYRDPVAKKVLECKKLYTLANTFLKGIERGIDSTSRLHTSFNQNKAVTGRLSSKNPNLQNIIHPDNDPFAIRKVFAAIQEGMRLIVADYSALEMMLLAEAAQDDKLIGIFLSGKDIHMGNASLVFGYPYEEIKAAKDVEKMVKAGKLPQESMTDRVKELLRARQFVKVISYGLNYGMKANKLAANLGITVGEAEALMQKYMSTYPAVLRFFDEVQTDLEKFGCVYTYLGRVRSLPEVVSPWEWEQWRAGRQAANFVIQGSAAECAKMAMIRLHQEKLTERTGWELLSQVHDEIIMEGPEETAEEAARILSDCMANPFWTKLRVPLQANPTIARSWQEAK